MIPRLRVLQRTMKEVREDCKLWASEIAQTFRPDIVIFIAKSGFLFAQPIAEFFGCPMADVTVKRPGDKVRDHVKKIFRFVPKFIWSIYVRISPLFNDKHTERIFIPGTKLQALNLADYRNILLVDDSADTGSSIVKAVQELRALAPESVIKTCCYCVIYLSDKRVSIDYFRYKDTVIFSGPSRYSPEYGDFLRSLEEWRKS